MTGILVMITMVLQGIPAEPAMLLNSFEKPEVLSTLVAHDVTLELSDQHATDGHRSLKVTFGLSQYPNVWLDAAKAYPTADWRGYGALVFDVFNPGPEPLEVNVRIDDSPQADGRVHCRQRGVTIPPGKQVTVSMGLAQRKLFMRAGPPAFIGDINVPLAHGGLNFSHIVAFQFFLVSPKKKHVLFLDNVRLAKAAPLEGIVDRFGQYTRADWPGKVHDEAELRRRREQEAAELEQAPLPPDRDAYGGWLKGPKLEATGWFRTAKVGGKWWLVTPEGHLFWSVGVDCVGLAPWSPIKGREYMFTWLPEKGDPLQRFGGKGQGRVNFFGINLWRKYGENYASAWRQVMQRRLRTWGVNTLGNWSDWDCYHELKIPYAAPAGTGGGARIPGVWRDMPDVYSADWPQVVERGLKNAVGAFGQDPYCIGYFVDNEMAWGSWSGGWRYLLVLKALKLGGDKPVKQAFARLLQTKYKDIKRLNAVWGTKFASWEEFTTKPVEPSKADDETVQKDLALLMTDYAQHYFSVVAATLKRLAPDQLYLGSRFSGTTPEVLAVADKYCDVVSFNIYGKASRLLEYGPRVAGLSKPVIIGEFHFGALDRGMFHGGLVPVPSQEDRGREYEAYVRTAARQPWCVGAHWFQCTDEPLTGRFDGENYNIGFLDVSDTPYPELIRHVRSIAYEVYDVRTGQ
ncbi:MAG: beta-galactosidase [Armatimonadetes bacterium]|nr:beta-galactosidase [Armatimonadota bacterium]